MDISFLLNVLLVNKEADAVMTEEKIYSYSDIYGEYVVAMQILRQEAINIGCIVSIISDFSAKAIAMLIALIEQDCILVPISPVVKEKDKYIFISQTEFVIDLCGEQPNISKTDIVPNHGMLLNLKGKAPGLILFSSGTTGEPKAALHNLCFLLEKFKKPGKVLRTITFLLFDHIAGFNTLFHALSNGGQLVLINSRDADVVCKMIELYRVELLPTSPTFLNILLLNKMYEKYDLSSLKIISYQTEPMPQSTLDFLHSIFPNTVLKQGYGLSEIGAVSTKSEKSDSLWIKIGGEGVETKIIDDILYIRTKSAMLGYLNAPNPFDGDGWFNTKDKVEQRKDGYIKILGRITDIINVGGEKVYPIEVEGILLRYKGVKDVHVFGERNPLTGNVVVAEISVSAENNNKDFVKELRNFCVENMERFKIPVKILLVEHDLYSERFKRKR